MCQQPSLRVTFSVFYLNASQIFKCSYLLHFANSSSHLGLFFLIGNNNKNYIKLFGNWDILFFFFSELLSLRMTFPAHAIFFGISYDSRCRKRTYNNRIKILNHTSTVTFFLSGWWQYQNILISSSARNDRLEMQQETS